MSGPSDETAARLAAIVESSDDAIVSKTLRGVITSWNPAAERMFGYTEAEAVGQHITLIIPEERRGEEDYVLSCIARGEAVRHFETVRVTRDGRRLDISLTVSPIRNAAGEVVGASKIARDITERKRSEHAANSSKARMDFLLRATQELAASLNYDSTLSRLVGIAVPEIADWAAVDLIEEGRLQRLAVAHLDPARASLVEEIERRYPQDPDAPIGTPNILRTGEPELVPEVPPEVLVAGARDAEHLALMRRLEPHSYVGVPLRVRDRTIGVLTFVIAESNRRYGPDDLVLAQALADRAAVAIENARLFRAAEQARASAETATRAKDEFLALLGHELRNPLAPIVTALALMRRHGGTAHDRERAVIERQVKHMTRLVDDLLDVSRITRGRVELEPETVDVADVVERAIEMASPLLEQRRHRLTVSVPPGLTLWADPSRLAQVVDNLLSNAAKYTEPGGHIEVGAEQIGREVELWVRDDGVGIAPELLPRVFDTFVQGGQSLDRARGGLGIGLAIVKSLVALHGGSVSAESEGAGRGSRFRVRLPGPKDGVARQGAEVGRDPAAHAVDRQATRILIVDDNIDAAELLGDMLGGVGYEIHLAHDGPTALALAARTQPDLALLDIGLPAMDGFELAMRLRELEGMGSVRLVAVTGYGQRSDRQRSSDAGFDAHLVKPVEFDELRATVERLVGAGGAS